MPPPSDPWVPPGPPSGQGPGRGRGWLFAVGVVSALVLTGIVATVVVLAMRTDGTTPTAASPAATRSAAPRAVPAPGSPTPTLTATPTPTPAVTPASTTSPTAAPQAPLPTAPTQPAPAPGPDRSLKTNALYGVDLDKASVSCDLKVRRPKPPLADKKLQPYLTDVVDCLTKVFEGPLAAQGFTLEQPKVQTYHKRVETPCGDFGQSGSPAYYCSGTRTIYWPDTVDDGREAYTFARLGYVGLVAHEFGHHLQKTTGMLDAYAMAHEKATSKGGSKKEGYALSRRLELQAQCFEGVFLHATAKDLDVSSKDRRELKAWHSYTGDEDPPDDRKPDHGSSKSQFGWLDRGLDSGDFADCNTWTASASKVG